MHLTDRSITVQEGSEFSCAGCTTFHNIIYESQITKIRTLDLMANSQQRIIFSEATVQAKSITKSLQNLSPKAPAIIRL
jgi:hypothetical protein